MYWGALCYAAGDSAGGASDDGGSGSGGIEDGGSGWEEGAGGSDETVASDDSAGGSAPEETSDTAVETSDGIGSGALAVLVLSGGGVEVTTGGSPSETLGRLLLFVGRELAGWEDGLSSGAEEGSTLEGTGGAVETLAASLTLLMLYLSHQAWG